MTAVDLLADARAAGIELSAVGDGLRFRVPAGKMTDELRDLLTRHKEGLLSALCGWPPRPKELAAWPIDLRQRWGERAAELQYSGLPWREAEKQAYAELGGPP